MSTEALVIRAAAIKGAAAMLILRRRRGGVGQWIETMYASPINLGKDDSAAISAIRNTRQGLLVEKREQH